MGNVRDALREPVAVSDPDLAPAAAKAAEGRRLDAADGLALFSSRDLPGIWAMADAVRRRLHGRNAFYAVNGHITPTNICECECHFCGFWRRRDGSGKETPQAGEWEHSGSGQREGYVMSVPDVLRAAQALAGLGVTELHITGGVNPDLSIGYYESAIRGIRSGFPRVGIRALTAVEVRRAADRAGMTLREALELLRAAGLDTIAGGGAEILVDGIRRKICPAKGSSAEWLDVHETAHRLGIRSSATMLFGHIESSADRVEHLLRIRELQDRTGGFLVFVPLPYRPERGASIAGRGPGPAEILRTIAVSRLMLDNIPHIKGYWPAMGMDVAQTALA
ncbi:MAG: radical SAM protein, partial [Planctomycetota bacterium]|nr:radical SAM protein [Planctomycetota bacterium]